MVSSPPHPSSPAAAAAEEAVKEATLESAGDTTPMCSDAISTWASRTNPEVPDAALNGGSAGHEADGMSAKAGTAGIAPIPDMSLSLGGPLPIAPHLQPREFDDGDEICIPSTVLGIEAAEEGGQRAIIPYSIPHTSAAAAGHELQPQIEATQAFDTPFPAASATFTSGASDSYASSCPPATTPCSSLDHVEDEEGAGLGYSPDSPSPDLPAACGGQDPAPPSALGSLAAQRTPAPAVSAAAPSVAAAAAGPAGPIPTPPGGVRAGRRARQTPEETLQAAAIKALEAELKACKLDVARWVGRCAWVGGRGFGVWTWVEGGRKGSHVPETQMCVNITILAGLKPTQCVPPGLTH
jgi:hypothetical protein